MGTSCGPVSVTSWCSVERDERINLVFGMKASFDQSYRMFKETQISTKMRAFPSGTLSQLPDLENFSTVYRTSNVLSA